MSVHRERREARKLTGYNSDPITQSLVSLLFLASFHLFAPSTVVATPKPSGVIAVSFENHNKEVPCNGLAVQLQLAGQTLTPTYTETGFTVPDEIKQLKDTEAARNTRVRVTITCNGMILEFPDVYATWFEVDWKVGIDYPPFAHLAHHAMPERGAWVSYLGTNGGGDGVEMWVSNPEPLPGMREQLREEQPAAVGGRARDIAYALAVYKDNYEKNRGYLLRIMRVCVARPVESPDDEVCDDDLVDYVMNLYWRGDETLLQPLLELANTRRRLIGDFAAFYADVLDRQPGVALNGLGKLDPQHQQAVCELAGDSLGDVPQRERIVRNLRKSRNGVSSLCLQRLQLGHGH